MYQKETFLRFISEIERCLLIFANFYKISFNAEIHFQQDWEVKDVKNIILQLKVFNISFKEELFIWKQLSHFIRKVLKMFEFNSISEEELDDYINYNKDFYIKINLE